MASNATEADGSGPGVEYAGLPTQPTRTTTVHSADPAPTTRDAPPASRSVPGNSPETNRSIPNKAPKTNAPAPSAKYASLPSQPAHAPDTQQLVVEVASGFGNGKNIIQPDVSASPQGTEIYRGNPGGAFADLNPTLGFAWTSGLHNWTTNFNGALPSAPYDNRQQSNNGLSRGAMDAGYTYQDPEYRQEFFCRFGGHLQLRQHQHEL